MIKRLLFILVAVLIMPDSNAQEKKNTGHYVFPEFYPGIVHFKDGRIEESKLNYNSLMEEMVFNNNGKFLAVANIDEIDTVYIQNRKFIPVEKKFQEVAVEGKIPLLLKYTCSIIPPAKPAGYGGTSQTSSISVVDNLLDSGRAYELEMADDYELIPEISYILFVDNKPVKVTKAKQVISLFPGKEDEIKKFIDSNKTDFRDRQDMIDLIAFCNKK